MPFSPERFERAEFAPRRQRVPVEPLASFFDDGEPAEWEVRGLTASELSRAMEASRRLTDIAGVVKAIASNADQVAAIRKALGLSQDTPGEIAKRLEMLVLGSVAPVIDLTTAVKLAETFPVEFLAITNVITELTGKGAELVKPGAASQTTTA